MKFCGLSSLQWPQESESQFKLQMRKKFFWTALLRALGVDAQQLEAIADSKLEKKREFK